VGRAEDLAEYGNTSADFDVCVFALATSTAITTTNKFIQSQFCLVLYSAKYVDPAGKNVPVFE